MIPYHNSTGPRVYLNVGFGVNDLVLCWWRGDWSLASDNSVTILKRSHVTVAELKSQSMACCSTQPGRCTHSHSTFWCVTKTYQGWPVTQHTCPAESEKTASSPRRGTAP
eukprot:2983202-Rhodomonas_salina.1